MDALDLMLTGLVAVLSTALALMLLARLRDLRTIRSDAVELEAARLRIAQLERRPETREPEPARRFSRV
jgi:hypothetical protein